MSVGLACRRHPAAFSELAEALFDNFGLLGSWHTAGVMRWIVVPAHNGMFHAAFRHWCFVKLAEL